MKSTTVNRETEQNHSAIPVYANKAQAALVVLGMSLINCMCLFVIWPQPGGPSQEVASYPPLGAALFYIVGIATILIVGVVIARGAYVLVAPLPLLIVEDEGIRLEPALFGNILIPWSHVASLSYINSSRIWQRWIYLRIDEGRHTLIRQNRVQKLLTLAWHSKFVTDGTFVLNAQLLAMPLDQLYALLQERGQRATGRQLGLYIP